MWINGLIDDAAQTDAIRPATNPASTIRIMNCISTRIQPNVCAEKGCLELWRHQKTPQKFDAGEFQTPVSTNLGQSNYEFVQQKNVAEMDTFAESVKNVALAERNNDRSVGTLPLNQAHLAR